MKLEHHLNLKIKRHGVPQQYTQEEVEEYIRCSQDPIYFIEKYVKINTIDSGISPFILRGYQKALIETYHRERKVIVLSARQSGKTITTAAYILWYICFNPDKTAVILANKLATSKEIFSRIILMMEGIPFFLQPGVKIGGFTKTSIECGNNSRLIASTTSSSNIRGFTVNLLYLDEFAFVNNATQFFTSSYPTITAGQTSKIIISSTFNGLNLFYYLWMGAKAGENGFYPFEVNWWEVPGRDEKWKEEQIAVLGEEKFRQEYGNEAIGSTHTLIAASYLKQIRPTKGKRTADGYEFIEDPIENHSYIISCDVARGTDNDYSVAIVVDVTSFPFKIVATFVDNQIRPVMFPDIIYKLAKKYNDAYVLIERNANGQDVVDILVNEYEYDNIFSTKTKTKVGQILSLGVGGRWIGGVEMTKNVKRIGCFVLKSLIEEQKLINITEKILNELYTFSKQRETYKAEPGNTDDCVMALVLFSWVVNQPFFKDMFNADFRKEILTKYMKENEEEDRVTPLFIHDGKTSYELEEFGF